jgi:hypothetical protein
MLVNNSCFTGMLVTARPWYLSKVQWLFGAAERLRSWNAVIPGWSINASISATFFLHAFAAMLFQIIGGLSGLVICIHVFMKFVDFCGMFHCVKPLAASDSGWRPGCVSHSFLVQVDACYFVLPSFEGCLRFANSFSLCMVCRCNTCFQYGWSIFESSLIIAANFSYFCLRSSGLLHYGKWLTSQVALAFRIHFLAQLTEHGIRSRDYAMCGLRVPVKVEWR